MKKPELLAPGGSFPGAHAAFEAGADGVYLGLKEFSARKAAQNFSLDQLRRIRQLAADRGRKVYVAVNTVIREPELDRLFETFSWLAALAVDGVIVQDLGACDMLRKEFPRLPLHASTQMAVHNDTGLRMAEELGIRRVILSRELTLDRIRELRQRHPGIELEVFIHGALCYSFSGVCLASSALTGRSANRGDCAQICRSLFRDEGEAGGAPRRMQSAPGGQSGTPRLAVPGYGHFFSARDLFLGRDVLALAEIGIDALKIEGRMKSPEYAFNVTRLYREILDRGKDVPEEEYAELVRRADLSFTREKTTGWLRSPSGSELIDQRYPGHRGSRLGTVESVNARQIRLRLAADLSVHDGLGYFTEGKREPVIFSVSRILKAGRETKFARAGEVVGVEVPAPAGPIVPQPGAEIRHLSSRFLDLPLPRETGFLLYKVPLDMHAGMSKRGVLSVRAAGFPVFEKALTIERASRKKPFVEILARMLGESGDSVFMPGNLSFTNETGLADDEVFVPPSQLKKAKNELYAFLGERFAASLWPPPAPAPLQAAAVFPHAESALSSADLSLLAHRQVVGPRHARGDEPGDGADIPFVSADPNRIDPQELLLHAGYRWLPLPPVLRDDSRWVGALRGLAEALPDTRFAVGLNNLSHLGIAAALGTHRNISFFADFYLYVANHRALSFVRERVPRLLFAYAWIEGARGDDEAIGSAGPAAVTHRAETPNLPVVALADDFKPPLFYSLGCFARHVSCQGQCFENCPGDFDRELRQGRNRFRVAVRDCVTYLFARSRD